MQLTCCCASQHTALKSATTNTPPSGSTAPDAAREPLPCVGSESEWEPPEERWYAPATGGDAASKPSDTDTASLSSAVPAESDRARSFVPKELDLSSKSERHARKAMFTHARTPPRVKRVFPPSSSASR